MRESYPEKGGLVRARDEEWTYRIGVLRLMRFLEDLAVLLG